MPGVVGLVLIAVLLMGLAGPVSAFAAKHKPVVRSVSPKTGIATGGTTVTITGKYFKVGGKNVVKKVTFGTKAAKHVRVKSATSIKVTTPAGAGRVNVRVITKAGTSAKVSAARFTFVGPATQMAATAGDNQTASLGAAVKVLPSVIVKDARGNPVPGVRVTFAVATGGGSVSGASTKTDPSGIAAVGSWKLGTTAGANTLTATSTGLTGSPVTFTATGDAGVLQVQLAGAPVRAYSLAEVQALTPFAGFAGINKATVLGPDAVTGAKVTDIVADALGAALAVTQSVEITNYVAPPGSPYFRTYTRDQLVNLAGSTTFTYADAGTKVPMTPTGTLAAILIYSDPDARVMPPANGPLRFVIADSLSENMVYGPSSSSISTVNVLNVITTP
jgi:adhesin/invasin